MSCWNEDWDVACVGVAVCCSKGLCAEPHGPQLEALLTRVRQLRQNFRDLAKLIDAFNFGAAHSCNHRLEQAVGSDRRCSQG